MLRSEPGKVSAPPSPMPVTVLHQPVSSALLIPPILKIEFGAPNPNIALNYLIHTYKMIPG